MRTIEPPTGGNEPEVLPGVPAGEPRKGPGIEPGTPAEDDDLNDTSAADADSRLDTAVCGRKRGPIVPMKRRFPTLLSLLVLGLTAAPARAEVYLTPSVGVAFGGHTDDSKLTYGGSLTFLGEDGVIGFAVDFGHTPDFFGTTGFGNNNITTLMGNLVLASPGRARIYGSGGLGLVKTRVKDLSGFFEVDSNEFGLNVGGGVLLSSGTIGFQGDIRYFRNLSDLHNEGLDFELGTVDYWRAVGGISLRF